jgi:hypothetical protein
VISIQILEVVSRTARRAGKKRRSRISKVLVIRQTHRKRASERRVITFTVLAFAFAFIWLLLTPIFSYEPRFPDYFPPPGTDLAMFKTP